MIKSALEILESFSMYTWFMDPWVERHYGFLNGIMLSQVPWYCISIDEWFKCLLTLHCKLHAWILGKNDKLLISIHVLSGNFALVFTDIVCSSAKRLLEAFGPSPESIASHPPYLWGSFFSSIKWGRGACRGYCDTERDNAK